MTKREGHAIVYRRVVQDERGSLYFDVSSDKELAAGTPLLIPLVVAKCEPESATASAATDTRSVKAATTSEATARRDDRDDDAFSSSLRAVNAGSSANVNRSSGSSMAGGPAFGGSLMFVLHLACCAVVMILSFANFWWRSVPLGVACVIAAAFLFGVAARVLAGMWKVRPRRGR